MDVILRENYQKTEPTSGPQTQHLKNGCDFRAAAVAASFVRPPETNRHISGD